MAILKRIVCLANSRKMEGRCVAGRELAGDRPGRWIRPVSVRLHQEVSRYERQYADGSDPRVLDLIDVPLRGQRSSGYQQENWLLDPDTYWAKVGRVSWAELGGLADADGLLWLNGHHTNNGLNDVIPLDKTASITSSLKLVHVEGLALRVFKPGEAFGNPKRRVQARFTFDGQDYELWVTDPRVERAYLAREDGEYDLEESYLTVSLGEPWEGNCYKLVAAVIQQE